MSSSLQGDAIAATIDVLDEERIIACPTGAVFGVGCDPDSETAVMRLLELKRHSVDKGLTLITTNYERLKPYVGDTMLTDTRHETIFSRWPGLATFVFPAPATTPHWLADRFDSLVVQVIDHPLVVALCQAHGKPLVPTNTNLNGLPSCRAINEVHAQFNTAFPVVPGEAGGRLNPSETRGALTSKPFRQG